MTTENSSTRERVLIVGAGFAGFECARRLPHLLAKDPRNQTEVILVSTHDYMLYTPLLPDVAGGILDPRYVSVPLAGSLPGVELITGRVTSVNFDSRTITLMDCDADVAQLHWDRLVLTPGSVTRTVDIPGLKENACGLKTVGEALYLRDQLLTQLELSTHETIPCRGKRSGRWSWSELRMPAPNWSPSYVRSPTRWRVNAGSIPRRSGSCCSTEPTG